jgi:putative ABC transport system permease protein
MNIISLTPFDLSLSALLIVAVVIANFFLRLNLGWQTTIAAIRTVVQLLLIGFVLHILFSYVHLTWIILLALVMLAVAAREVVARQARPFKGWWGYGFSISSLLISSFTVTLFALLVIISTKPWYTPQYAIPLLGMIIGNSMNGVTLSLDQLTKSAWQQRAIIEQRLLLGQSAKTALLDIRRDSMRTGMIPTINAMAVAGIVSLPGMMTGQILAGISPMEAVKYQIMIMFLISASASFGIMFALWLGTNRLFDKRDRLRLDRLESSKASRSSS